MKLSRVGATPAMVPPVPMTVTFGVPVTAACHGRGVGGALDLDGGAVDDRGRALDGVDEGRGGAAGEAPSR